MEILKLNTFFGTDQNVVENLACLPKVGIKCVVTIHAIQTPPLNTIVNHNSARVPVQQVCHALDVCTMQTVCMGL